MEKSWTFGQKLGAGYAVMVLIVLVLSAIAIFALRSAVESKDRVINVNAKIQIEAQRLSALDERISSLQRAYWLARESSRLDQVRMERQKFDAALANLESMVYTDEARRLVDAIERAAGDYRRIADQLNELVQQGAESESVVRTFDQKAAPLRRQLDDQINMLVAHDTRLLEAAQQASNDAVSSTVGLLAGIAAGAVLLAIAIGYALVRALSRQIGTAVSHVQSSSTELQAAATQQASGAKQQANAMNEIATTISELVATSRQIAESAQRVAQIASQTASAARHGEGTVGGGQESIAGIRRQVDQVVAHMLDLGKKSQQIGAVLDIVSELAEQTNILAINATIEASGAGENGRRFAVVADEIRKLADRVANSTKEIRGLIDDVRSAVNTTVMATESTAKAVEFGSRQFSEVAVAFKQIAGLVGTTTEAAREIELSTKQQATAAEQVRTAVADVTQATHETEASTGQTLQTSSQLASLSRDLMRLVRPQAATV
ncbi:MAG: methyl-accepting chemotaxis protein [Burkholderiales bacterium]